MLAIDLTGKHAWVAGVADERGFGFAIARALAEAGATVSIATWPPTSIRSVPSSSSTTSSIRAPVTVASALA